MGWVVRRAPWLWLLVVAGVGLGAVAPAAHATVTSKAVAYVFDDTLFPCGSSGCGMNDSFFPGGSIFTNAVTGTQPGTGNTGTYAPSGGSQVTLTNVPLSTLDANPQALSGFDTAILYQLCNIGASSNRSALSAINAFVNSGGKVMIFDADGCAPSSNGTPDWSAFVFPFATNNPGPQGAAGSYTAVEASSLTTGLSPGPVTGDAVGDANVFTTFDPHWFQAVAATNTNGVTGTVMAYARTSSGGLALYSGEDFWYTDGADPHLQQVFDDMLNQQWDPDKLPSTIPVCSSCTGPPIPTTWTGKSAHWSNDLLLPGAGVFVLRVEDTLTPSAVFSSTMHPPSVLAHLPLSVDVKTDAGDVKLDLFRGTTSGSPAALSADPPFPKLVSLELPSAKELADAIHPKNGWFAIPLGKGTRSMTLSLTNIAPLSFSSMLGNEVDASYRIPQAELEAVAAVATVAVIIASLPEDAAAIVAALAVRGVTVAAGAIADVIESVLVPALEGIAGAGARIITSIPGALAGAASGVWNGLTHLPVPALAVDARGSSPPVEGPLTKVARVLSLRSVDLQGLRAQLLKGALANAARASLLSLPVKTVLRPLVASQRLPRGGRAIVLLGGALPGTKAQLVITGPGYGAVRDVRITHGLAGGRIVLPRRRRAGRWYAGVVDYSGLHVKNGRVIGHAILEAATWVVRR